jgi:hypothetical protein
MRQQIALNLLEHLVWWLTGYSRAFQQLDQFLDRAFLGYLKGWGKNGRVIITAGILLVPSATVANTKTTDYAIALFHRLLFLESLKLSSGFLFTTWIVTGVYPGDMHVDGGHNAALKSIEVSSHLDWFCFEHLAKDCLGRRSANVMSTWCPFPNV